MRSWFLANRSRFLLALFSGVMLTLAFPKFDQGWLAWIALVPLLLAMRECGWRIGLGLGFIAGMAHNLSLTYWTAHTMHTYGKLPLFQSIFLLILLAAYLSLFPALFAAGLGAAKAKPALAMALAPLIWTALEYVRAWLFTGFPWELLGYSQYDHLWTIQIADLFGVYGVSALIVWFNTVLSMLILLWLEKPWQHHEISKSSVGAMAAVLAVTLLGTVIYGHSKIDRVDDAIAKSKTATIAVVQGNIDQASKWDTRFQTLTTIKYKKLSAAVAADPVDLIIWPETATPFFFLYDKVLSGIVVESIKSANTHFLIGSPSYASDQDKFIYFNSAYLMTPQGKKAGRYDKVHLVPFGEYVPIKRWLPFIDKLVAQVGDFKSGKSGNTLKWDDQRIGLQICYEVIFPALARAMVQNGATLLVNITNDAWFGRTGAAYQHFSMAVFRAVENRRSLARAANTGISGFIDPCGRILDATPIYQEATATATIPLLTTRSLYSRWGDWPLALLSFGMPLVILARRFMNHRRKSTT